MNDSPVDCQNRDRLFRRKASPTWGATSERTLLRSVFCLHKNQSHALSFLLFAKSHARFACSFVNALTTANSRYHLFAIWAFGASASKPFGFSRKGGQFICTLNWPLCYAVFGHFCKMVFDWKRVDAATAFSGLELSTIIFQFENDKKTAWKFNHQPPGYEPTTLQYFKGFRRKKNRGFEPSTKT